MARYSLNEIDGMARKAARGAGMPWGLAEEAGKAARWLGERDWPGLALLLDHLDRNDGAAYADIRPVPAGRDTDGRHWRAEGDALCPIAAGAALNDVAGRIAEGEPVTLEAVAVPMLLVPFLGRAAHDLATGFELSGPDGAWARLHADGPELLAEPPAGPLTARRCPTPPGPAIRPRRLDGVEIDDALWRRAEAYAARTYVPASEESRLAGAGAGVSDSD